MKVSKLLGALLLPIGIYILYSKSSYSIYGYVSITISVIYMLRGFWIFAYRGKSVWKKDEQKIKLILRIKNSTTYEKLAYFISSVSTFCLTLMYFYKTYEFLNNFNREHGIFPIISFFCFFIFLSYMFSYLIFVKMISPLIVVKRETRRAIVKDSAIIEERHQKGYKFGLYIFFEDDDRCFVTYRIFTNKIKELIGYECEYTVCTSILGAEFIRKIPKKISDRKYDVNFIKNENLSARFNVKMNVLVG